jgi:hypothetical protein
MIRRFGVRGLAVGLLAACAAVLAAPAASAAPAPTTFDADLTALWDDGARDTVRP